MYKRLLRIFSLPFRRLLLNPPVNWLMQRLFDWLSAGQFGRCLLNRFFRRYRWYYLMLARNQRKQGDDNGAYHTLMMGQRCPVDDYRIHLKLSELYRDDGNVFAAHTHLKFASILNPGY